MWFKLFYYLEEPNKLKNFLDMLKELGSDFRIITDSYTIANNLKKEGYDSSILDHLVPESGNIVKDVYKISKQMIEEYRTIFKSLTYHKFEIFEVFDFKLFLQLHLLARIKMLLNNNTSLILILNSFYPVYFAAIDMAIKMGYQSEFRLGMLKDNKIEYVDFMETKGSIKHENSIIKIKRYTMLSISKSGIHKLKNIFYLFTKLSVLVIKLFVKRIHPIEYNALMTRILNQLGNKILNFDNQYECVFFISGSREDIYLKPLYAIFDKLKNDNKKFVVITDNFTTSIILSKQRLPFLNLFDNIKVLNEILKSDNMGKNLLTKITQLGIAENSPTGLEQMRNHIFDQSVRAINLISICEYLIKKINPKTIFVGLDGELLENSAIMVARHENIPSFSLLTAITNPNPVVSEWFHADKIFVYGQHGKKMLMSLGYNEERIVVTGHPKYDFLKKINHVEARAFLKKEHAIDSTKKIIVIAMSMWHNDDHIWMSDFIKFCNKNHFEIIIKVHPMYKNTNMLLNRNKVKLIKETCSDYKYLITHDTDIYILLAAADLIITDFSNVGIEGLLLEKPVFSINFVKKWDYLDYNKINSVEIIHNYTQLKKQTQKVLETSFSDKMFHIKEDIEEYNFKNDGNASDRIVNFLSNSN
jgi:hypothetical protein